MNHLVLFCLFLTTFAFSGDHASTIEQPPNVVIIYADDMGYGDLAIQNPDSKIPTPNLDRLAREGMRFTDAHSSSGICSPSRYALLAGKYHWRRQHNIVNSFGPPFFADSDVTLPQVLRDHGYNTACIGKWHLGWDWTFRNDSLASLAAANKSVKVNRPEDVDFSGRIAGGPLSRGFDYYFGDGTINFPPYAWFENDRLLEMPTEMMHPDSVGYEVGEGKWEFRPGPKVAGWNPYEVLPTVTDKAVEYIGRQSADKPFFLYFALPSPHAPIIPNEEFVGKTEAGSYGDFMYETDYMIGRVLTALEEAGFAENTLVIFSSDNGPEHYAFPRAERYNHLSMGELRGLKRDVWEGGHRVPMIVRWPGEIEGGAVREQTISQIDLMPTVAAVAGIDLPSGAAPDGYDQSSLLTGAETDAPVRRVTVHNTYAPRWGLRDGDWLYLDGPSGGVTRMPEEFAERRGFPDFDSEVLLFNLRDDPGQRLNLSEEHPERVKRMQRLLEEKRK
ncbi:sulfatase-like hydrolase/transferase [Lewinella sp. JB7]|uniref:sulfatase-like hydrolase/transferase n=1 Tax=Lewinella sp. JB7 TaxID=2962887 RepID=UPI0020CA0F47|nr:sulfatase-like hydrolase/transferase [Lewinella sp. JB7]MCP9235272.1 sulfatase-like hydrolase/transferase [Lewinella sp. JB7]